MLEDLLTDPMFYFAVSVFIVVITYFYWIEKRQNEREKERKLEERIKQLEKKIEEQQKNSQ